MLIGPRAASIPIQLVALLLGIVEGVLLHYMVIGALPVVLQQVGVLSPSLTAAINGPVLFLSIAFCAYFLAAPTTWRGLGRRALLLLAISLLGYAILGYLLAFAFTRGTPIPGSMPSWILPIQAGVVVIGLVALVGYLLMRDRKQRDFLESATVPAPESAYSSGPPNDPQI
jgi:phosphoglycerol transferase MdoB-like AlkP superfamily enzyme